MGITRYKTKLQLFHTVPLTREEEEMQEMQERASVEAAAKSSSMVSSDMGDEDEEDNDWEQILIQNLWNNFVIMFLKCNTK